MHSAACNKPCTDGFCCIKCNFLPGINCYQQQQLQTRNNEVWLRRFLQIFMNFTPCSRWMYNMASQTDVIWNRGKHIKHAPLLNESTHIKHWRSDEIPEWNLCQKFLYNYVCTRWRCSQAKFVGNLSYDTSTFIPLQLNSSSVPSACEDLMCPFSLLLKSPRCAWQTFIFNWRRQTYNEL